MTFTEKEIQGAALLIMAEAEQGIPRRIYDFLTKSQLEALLEDIRQASMDSLLFCLMNYTDGE